VSPSLPLCFRYSVAVFKRLRSARLTPISARKVCMDLYYAVTAQGDRWVRIEGGHWAIYKTDPRGNDHGTDNRFHV
jgi:hypothetical protein